MIDKGKGREFGNLACDNDDVIVYPIIFRIDIQ